MNKKLISIITPVYNEEESLENYFQKITEALKKHNEKYTFEIIITDNCSTDNTFSILKNFSKIDKRFKIFKLSKNFGYQKSLWTAYCQANGDAVIPFDCDLQDPPHILENFFTLWENGNDIVYGVRTSRQEKFFSTRKIVDLPFLRNFFYYILNKISDDNIPRNSGDFMLVDKKIVSYLKKIHDHNIYLRGVIFSLGFKKAPVEYEREKRIFGKTKFNFGKSLKLALDGIIGSSGIPLRIASLTGIVISIFTMSLSIFFILSKFMFNINYPAGLTTIIVLVLLGISLNALFLGIIGEYLSRIYDQQKNRPVTIIEERIDNT